MNKAKEVSANVWPFCETCPSRTACTAEVRQAAPFMALSFCVHRVACEVEDRGKDGTLLLLPQELLDKALQALYTLSEATHSLQDLSYILAEESRDSLPIRNLNPAALARSPIYDR